MPRSFSSSRLGARLLPPLSDHPAARARVRRAPAVVDLRRPAVGVWAGEVVIVVGPHEEELAALARGAGRHARGELYVVGPVGESGLGVSLTRLTRLAGASVGVLAVARLTPGPRACGRLAAWRVRVASHAPCRCLWLVGDRAYAE